MKRNKKKEGSNCSNFLTSSKICKRGMLMSIPTSISSFSGKIRRIPALIKLISMIILISPMKKITMK